MEEDIAPWTRRDLLALAQIGGVSLKAKALEALERHLRNSGVTEPKEVMAELCGVLRGSVAGGGAGAGRLIDLPTLEAGLSKLLSQADTNEANHYGVLSALDVPRLRYDNTRSTFYVVAEGGVGTQHCLIGDAATKAAVYRDRHDVVFSRAMRYRRDDSTLVFMPPSFERTAAAAQSNDRVRLRTVLSLEGTPPDVVITLIGLLTTSPEEALALEDHHGVVPLEMGADPQYTVGLFTEGCFVMVQGTYQNGRLHVQTLGFPPAEDREDSLQALGGGLDFFGMTSLRGTLDQEAHATEKTFVFLADVVLSNPAVVHRLHDMLGALSKTHDPSSLHFFLMGNFGSQPFSYGDGHSFEAVGLSARQQYVQRMEELAETIAAHPDIAARAHFVIMPGPWDPTVGGFILPQAPLTPSLVGTLRRKVSDVVLQTNPCRVRYHSREVVVFRDDLYSKMRRSCILTPKDGGEAYQHLAKTIVDQAHLSPVPLTVTPIYWEHDAALRLFPLPHLLVVADTTSPSWETEYAGCTVLNPGSFSEHGTVVFYQPIASRHEFAQMT